MKLFLLYILPVVIFSYLELKIHRYPTSEKRNVWENKNCSQSKLPEQYTQVCYHKDISYSVQFAHGKEYYYMSIDFTTPLSWIKGPSCKIQNKKSSCSRMQRSIVGEIQKGLKKVENKIKQQLSIPIFDPQQQTGETVTMGSIDRIQGKLQRARNIQFQTKDKGKLQSFYNLILIGLFFANEQTHINLKNTNFIVADVVNNYTDKICDGAISLRFDDQSQKSFLNEIFEFIGSPHKFITIYLGENSVITIGDLSVKNSEKGYSGIDWIKLDEKKYPQVTQIFIEDTENEELKQQQLKFQAIFTLSASYISVPGTVLTNLFTTLKDVGTCKIGVNDYIECKFDGSQSYQNKRFTIQLEQIKISFDLQELIKSSSGKNYILNIRKSESEYIILGEPVFKKYFVAFDYEKNKIGIAERRKTITQKLFGVVSLVRFIIMVFILGCCTMICYNPLRNFVKKMNLKSKIKKGTKQSSQSTKLRYASIDQNPYEDIKGKVQQVFAADEVQGI